MRIIQTIAGTRLDHGGTSRSVPAICNALVEVGVDNYLITARPADQSIECNYPRDHERVRVAIESIWLRQLGVGNQFQKYLAELTSTSKNVVVHDHAVWLSSNHAVATFCREYQLLRVVSPRGMLGSWALGHGRWKKRLAWAIYQHRDLTSAAAFHATSEQEAAEIRGLGLEQPIVIAPNGMDIPVELPARRNLENRQALFLSRIHPKKGLVGLVRSWKDANVRGDWKLVIAGPDENNHQREVEALVVELGLTQYVKFVGPIDDHLKWQYYVDSDLFILPSYNENFGIVIAEAMAAGLPVITTTGTPWQVLQEKNMGWWIPPDVRELTAALKTATSLSPEVLANMGSRAKEYVTANFSWQKSAEMLAEFYARLLADRQAIGR